MTHIVQYGTLPCRLTQSGKLEILLITSRETGRWVVPRGNPIPNLDPQGSAAQETFEEAGVRGDIGPGVGSYRYEKRRRDGSVVPALVHLFRLAVTEEADQWPEKGQRARRWFEPDAAADAVEEAELKALIRNATSA